MVQSKDETDEINTLTNRYMVCNAEINIGFTWLYSQEEFLSNEEMKTAVSYSLEARTR